MLDLFEYVLDTGGRMTVVESPKLELTREEKGILAGEQGATAQRIMRTIAAHGEALGAERLVTITGMGHLVISHAIPGISPSLEMLDELAEAGLKTPYPFTVDPAAPMDFDNWGLDSGQRETLARMYRDQPPYDEKMLRLGLRGPKAYTCTPYLPEVGPRPKRGDILAWSESACVVFANSVLGARSNRNGAILDLLCNIAGKTPLAGLLTDEGRKATWRIDVQTKRRPLPQLLGAAIGRRVLAEVPYIVGLDRFLGSMDQSDVRDYLHEMGATAAAAGAVGLYHVENITPEAVDYAADLLVRPFETYTIDDAALWRLHRSYPVLWENPGAPPGKCFLGCPHLSLNQLEWWADNISKCLKRRGVKRLKVKTTICAAPRVLETFMETGRGREALSRAGAKFSFSCPMQLFDNDLSKNDNIITNSNKLRTYTHARFFPDEQIADIVATGELPAHGSWV